MTEGFYPMKFEPIFKEKIWGGNKIRDFRNKDTGELPNCGESWELSGVKGSVTRVSNGKFKNRMLNDLVNEYPAEILGRPFASNKDFPLLIKFLDANDDLSIQVHPNDDIAIKKHDSFGKTEMWYIISADPGSKMYVGFNKYITKEKFLEEAGSNKILESICTESVSAGDVFYVPAGRIHSIGKGILLAEIQQTSDITYRIYDFERLGSDGNPRELHLKEAAEALNFSDVGSSFKSKYESTRNYSALVQSPYFNTFKIKGKNATRRKLSDEDSFRIYMIISGFGNISWSGNQLEILKGDVVLIPACLNEYEISSGDDFEALEIHL